MGDSITEGFGLGNDSAIFYPTALNEYLGPAYSVLNKGVTSSCVIDHEIDGEVMGLPYVRQPRYTEAIAAQGDIYVIMLGTNDASDGYNPDTKKKEPLFNMIKQKEFFIPSYQTIINDVRKAVPKAKIFLVTPIPIMKCLWPKHQERYLAKLLPMIRHLARENKTYFIDLHKEFLLLPIEQLENLYQPDGLHPNVVGAQVIASIIAGFIKAKH
jgi:lysophospholipase L1-like esterase